MPAKGYKIKRENIISHEFVKEFNQKTGLNLDYKTVKNVIITSNQEISNIVIAGNNGFRLPKGLGIISVNKYKTDKKSIDWVNSNKLGKRVYHLNMHSYSNMFTIKWFRIDVTKLYLQRVYKFRACRDLKRAVAKYGKETNGSKYFNWTYQDFYNVTRLERFLIRRNKNKE